MIATLAPMAFPTTRNPSRVAEVKPFPLQPSAFWDNPAQWVRWTDIHPQSKFGLAVKALGLPFVWLRFGKMECITNQEELACVLVYAWGHP